MNRATWHWAWVAGVLTAAPSCGRGEESSEGDWQVVRDTVGDTVIVRTLAGTVGAPVHQLIGELRIGEIEGRDEYMFGEVRTGMTVGPDGNVYVFDHRFRELRQYSADGAFVRRIGRSGEGPGEYQYGAGIRVLPDKRLLIWDGQLGRFTIFEPDGQFVRSFRGRGGIVGGTLEVDSAGHAVVMIAIRLDPARVPRIGFARYQLDGTFVDSVMPPFPDFQPLTVGANGPSLPFTPTIHRSWSPLGYLVTGLTDRYAVHLVGPGRRVLRIERAAPPVPVRAEEKAEREAWVTAGMRMRDPGWRWRGPTIPDTKPPYRLLQIGGDGRIWLLASRPALEMEPEEVSLPPGAPPPLRWREPDAFEVFEPAGTYLGEVAVPPRTRILVTRGNHAWGVSNDSLGVQYVVRFRIEPPLGVRRER